MKKLITSFYVLCLSLLLINTSYIFPQSPESTNFECGSSTVIYGGKTYNTVQVGNQCWLKENLNVGIRIDGIQNQTDNGTTEKYCFNNLETNCDIYGGLYQWNEAMNYNTTPGSQGICPPGWHIPALIEMDYLSSAVNHEGNALKAIGQGAGAGAGTNSSGFTALLGGLRSQSASFTNYNYLGVFWASSQLDLTWARYLQVNAVDNTIFIDLQNKISGLSVRCIKDAALQLNSPVGGENWVVGSAEDILWSSTNIQFIKIEYSTNNGNDWITITGSTSAGAGSYSWILPDTPTTEGKVRISDNSNTDMFAISNSFSIIELTPPVITLWERSVADASLPTWFGTNTERGLAYGNTMSAPTSLSGNDRVFVVSRSSELIKVRILNADTGADVGELNTTGITGGTFALNDIEVTSDGIILGCNLTTNATSSPFKVYMWANEGSAPVEVFAFTAADAVRLGDNFSVIGNYLAGTAEIWAASASAGLGKIYKWTMTGGSFNAVPEIINLSDNAAGGSAAVGPLANGDFYWNAGGHSAKKYSANGTLIGTIPGGVVATGSNAIVFLGSIGTDEYVVTYQFGAGNHNARVVEVPAGMPDSASTYGLTESMGSAANVGGTGDVAVKHNPDGSKDIFVLGTNNGVGAYRSTQSIPVELGLFTAVADGRSVMLSWRTITESNTAGFEIERRNGNEWKQVGYVTAAGNSTEPVSYSYVDSEVNAGSYGYRLRIVDFDGTFEYSPVAEVEVGVPMVYAMSQNYPNPFNPTTRIDYKLPEDSDVSIELYSVTGEMLSKLVSGYHKAGYYSAEVDAESLNLSSGIYLYRMIATDFNGKIISNSKKMILMK